MSFPPAGVVTMVSLLSWMIYYCFSFNILFEAKNPLKDMFGYIQESLPIRDPGFKTTLHPICALSPMIAPNLISSESIFFYPYFVKLIFFPSSLKFEVIAPAAKWAFDPRIESPT